MLTVDHARWSIVRSRDVRPEDPVEEDFAPVGAFQRNRPAMLFQIVIWPGACTCPRRGVSLPAQRRATSKAVPKEEETMRHVVRWAILAALALAGAQAWAFTPP